MKLKSLKLKNIASHKDTFYEFKEEDDIYLILGRNGCLAGQTLIDVFIDGMPQKVSIKYLYETKDTNKTIYVRSFKEVEGGIRLNDALDFVYSGKKLVYNLVLENGLTLTATKNHKILTRKGYIPLFNLSNYDEVMCDEAPKDGVPTYSFVKSVSQLDVVDTYDIQCKAPYHNFVANDIVVHNSGKTSFIGSIPLALFGDDPYYGNLYDCVRKGSEEEGSEIEIIFLVNNIEYRVLRKIKITKSTKSTESYLYKEGELVAGPKVKEFDNAIENLLSNKKVFLSSVFTSQNVAEDITEMPVSERTELLNRLWDLSFLQTLSDKAKEEVKTFNNILVNKKQEVDEFDKKISQEDEYVTKLESIKYTISDLKNKKEHIQKEIEELKTKIKDTESLEGLKQEYNSMLGEYNSISSKISALISENNDRIKKIEEETSLKNRLLELNGIEEKIDILEKGKEELSVLFNQKSSLDSKLSNTEYMLKSIEKEIVQVPCNELSCPYFTQMDERKKKTVDLRNEIDTITNESKILLEKISLIKYNSVTDIQANIVELRKNVSEKSEINTKLNSISFYKETIEKNNIQISEATLTTKQLEEKLSILDLKIKELIANTDGSLKIKLSNTESEIGHINNKYEESLRLEGSYTNILKEIEQVKSFKAAIVEEIKNINTEIMYYTIIKEDFSKKGIQSMVINKLKSELEKVIKDLLSTLSNNQFSISLSTKKELASGEEKESLEILVGDTQGIRDISQFSGGEKKLLKLIIRLALGIYQSIKNKVKYSCFFLDEATDALDQERRLEFVNIIQGLNKYFKQVMFITHSEDMVGSFPTKLEFVKDGYTKIV